MASGSATAEEISQDVIFARNGCSSNLARKQTLLALLQRVTAGAGRKAMPRDEILQKIKHSMASQRTIFMQRKSLHRISPLSFRKRLQMVAATENW